MVRLHHDERTGISSSSPPAGRQLAIGRPGGRDVRLEVREMTEEKMAAAAAAQVAESGVEH
jgi:hypothetical protein